MENMLKSNNYLAGDFLSIADIIAASELAFSPVFNVDLATFPKVFILFNFNYVFILILLILLILLFNYLIIIIIYYDHYNYQRNGLPNQRHNKQTQINKR